MEKNSLKNEDINICINKNNKKLEQDKNIGKMIYILSDKKDQDSISFVQTLINNNTNNDSSNDFSNKKIIKVNKDNRTKSKNIITSKLHNNSNKKTNKKLENINIEENENISIAQKINKFESRIDNLLNVINDFETKYIKSPETQRIKDQFNAIINKKIYKNKISNNPLYKSWIKTDYNNDNFINKDNKDILKDSFIMDIKNINISINNNKYENNYFITQSNQNKISHHKPFHKKQNSNEKKINIKINNNSILKNLF